ncbi:MAG: DUF6064 family protein [Anaerolineae bacterium]
MDTVAFWDHVAAYNVATWPIQTLMVVAAVYLTYRVFAKPSSKTDVWMKAFLAFCFAWNGIIFFLIFVRNPISMFTGVPLFLVVSVLFIVDIFANKTHFKLPEGKWMRGFTLVWIALTALLSLAWMAPGTHVAPGLVAAVPLPAHRIRHCPGCCGSAQRG